MLKARRKMAVTLLFVMVVAPMLSSLFINTPSLKPVFATATSVIQVHSNANGNSVTLTPTSGNYLVVTISKSLGFATPSLSDTFGDTFTQVFTFTYGEKHFFYITGPLVNSTSDTVVDGAAGNNFGTTVYEVHGISGTVDITATAVCSTTRPYPFNPPECNLVALSGFLVPSANDVIIGVGTENPAAISGCTPETGWTASPICGVAGGAAYNLGEYKANYAFPTNANMTIGGTGDNWEWAVVAFTGPDTATQALIRLTCTMSNGAPQVNVTLSGGSPSPSTSLCNGVSHTIIVSISSTLTATEPAVSSNQRDVFYPTSTPTTSLSFSVPSLGYFSWSFHNYDQRANGYMMTPTNPAIWDDNYSKDVTGILGGNSSTLCTIDLSSGGGMAGCPGFGSGGYTVPHVAHGSFGPVSSFGFAMTVVSGDAIILADSMGDGSSGGSSDTHITGITDTQSNTWSLVKRTQLNFGANCNAGNCLDDEIWSTTASASGSNTFNATFSTTTVYGNIELIDASGVSATASGTASGTCTSDCTTSLVTSTSLTFGSTDIPVSSVFSSCDASGALSPGYSGFIKEGPTSIYDGAMQYGNSTGPPSSSTNFKWTCSNISFTNGINIGAVFPTTSTIGFVWGDYDQTASLLESFPSALGPPWLTIDTFSWSDTTGGNTHNANYTLAMISITVDTNPTSLTNSIIVDSITYTSPHIFSWFSGTTHSIAAITSVSGLMFGFWNDGGTQTHNVSPMANTTYIATYTAHIIIVTYTSTLTNALVIDGTLYSSGSHAFNWAVSSSHNITARATALSPSFSLYNFNNWSNSGTRSQLYTVTVNATLTANYGAQASACSLFTNVFTLLLNRCIVGVWYFTFAGVLGNFGAGITVAAIAIALYLKNDNPTLAIFWTMIASGVLGVMLPVAFAPVAGMLFIIAIAGSVFQATRSRPKE